MMGSGMQEMGHVDGMGTHMFEMEYGGRLLGRPFAMWIWNVVEVLGPYLPRSLLHSSSLGAAVLISRHVTSSVFFDPYQIVQAGPL